MPVFGEELTFVLAILMVLVIFTGQQRGARACDAGYAPLVPSEPGSNCIPCNNGHYSSNAGFDRCASCAPGTFAGGTRATACTACEPGTFADHPASASCKACGPGTVSAAGSPTCIPCGAGTQPSTTIPGVCEPCPRGTAGALAALGTCVPCPPGSYSDATGLTRCIPCPLGTMQAGIGSESCEAVAHGGVTLAEGAASATEVRDCAELFHGATKVYPTDPRVWQLCAAVFDPSGPPRTQLQRDMYRAFVLGDTSPPRPQAPPTVAVPHGTLVAVLAFFPCILMVLGLIATVCKRPSCTCTRPQWTFGWQRRGRVVIDDDDTVPGAVAPDTSAVARVLHEHTDPPDARRTVSALGGEADMELPALESGVAPRSAGLGAPPASAARATARSARPLPPLPVSQATTAASGPRVEGKFDTDEEARAHVATARAAMAASEREARDRQNAEIADAHARQRVREREIFEIDRKVAEARREATRREALRQEQHAMLDSDAPSAIPSVNGSDEDDDEEEEVIG